MSTPTPAQLETFLNFLEEHRELARGNLRSVEGRALARRLWEQITISLNSMGGCTKTMKQWQKVWTDKKYLAKKAAVAARRSAAATGGGPSTAPQLSQWELKVISIMGDGFGEPQTTATVPAFEPIQEPTAASQEEDLSQQNDQIPVVEVPEVMADPVDPHVQVRPDSRHDATDPPSSRRRRTLRPRSASADGSVRARLFGFEARREAREISREAREERQEAREERREAREGRQGEELAAIRANFHQFCGMMAQLITDMQARNN